MSEPLLAASIVPWVPTDVAQLLWAKRTADAPALPGFHVCPGGLLEDADEDAPNDGGENLPLRVAGLRELFEETGILHARGPTLSTETGTATSFCIAPPGSLTISGTPRTSSQTA